jgi:hypothetical protein
MVIPNSVTSIGQQAFAMCLKMASIYIGSGVNSIVTGSAGAFRSSWDHGYFHDAEHVAINVDANNQTFSSVDGILYNKSQTTLIQCPEGKVGAITSIPATVTHIDDYGFNRCSKLTSVTIPLTVTQIGKETFVYCESLVGILTIPPQITYIGTSAFYGCTGFTGTIVLPATLTNGLGTTAFKGCTGLTGVVIEEGVTALPISAFEYCLGLSEPLTFPSTLTTIGNSAFYGCRKLPSVIVPSTVTNFSDGVFTLCEGLKSAEIDIAGVLKASTFRQCHNLESVIIGNGITSIGNYAFMECNRLTSVTIPELVTSIGSYAFYSCGGITNIVSKNTTPPAIYNNSYSYVFSGSGTYGAVPTTTPIIVPCSAVEAYQAAPGWSSFSNISCSLTAIDALPAATAAKAVAYYNLQGQKLTQAPARGIYIVLYDDGRAEKVVRKNQ